MERIMTAGVLGECVLETGKTASNIAPSGQQQSATARQDGERPGAVQGPARCVPGGEDVLRLIELADGDQGLEQVAQLQTLSRLEHEVVAQLVRAPQMPERRARVPERELHKAEHPAMTRLRDADPSASARAIALRARARASRPGPGGQR